MTILMTSLWSVWVRRCVNIQREVALGLSYPLRWNAENVYDGASVTSARMRQGAEGDRSQYRSPEGWFEQQAFGPTAFRLARAAGAESYSSFKEKRLSWCT